jgi:acetylornithine deacetylase/succinyl-diaminopimelate desuccinylase-like protein
MRTLDGIQRWSGRRAGTMHTAPARPPILGIVWITALAVALLAAGRTPGAEPDWARLGEETAGLLQELLRVDTTNPPGNETPAARLLGEKLEAAGIPAEVIESGPGRGNLHARLEGRGRARPLILLSHLDVVPADPRGWEAPPFAGERRGYDIYGRGALDAKGVAALHAMSLIALRRSGTRLDRDVILLATADEEAGGRAGAGWIVEKRPELLADAEYLLTEGDHIHERADGRRVVQVAVAEKTPCWVELTATGAGGHGSTPAPDTAVTRLVRALDRVRRWDTPLRVVPAVAEYFAALAPLEAEPLATRLLDLEAALRDPGFRASFLSNPRQNALVRNTVTPTVLAAGTRVNVVPPEARARLDCRLLPGEDPQAFLARLRRVIADDTIRLEPLLSFAAAASDSDSPLMAAVRQVATELLAGAVVVPSVLPGFTDSHYFRARGITSYGFVPFVLTEEEARTIHGVNERVTLDNLRRGLERMVALLRALPS